MLQVDNVFITPTNQAARARSKHRDFEVEEGDLKLKMYNQLVVIEKKTYVSGDFREKFSWIF